MWTTAEQHSISVRERQPNVLLSCPDTTDMLRIDEAVFRQDCDSSPCTSFNPDCNGISMKNNTLSIVEHWCNYKPRCYLSPDVHQFGDPCPNKPKVLEVQYTCVTRKKSDASLFQLNCFDSLL